MAKFRVGQEDGSGNRIEKIYQQGKRDNGDFFIFYEDSSGILKYGARGYYSKKITPLKNVISELSQLSKRAKSFPLNRNRTDLNTYYNGIIAGNITSFFSINDYKAIEKKVEELKDTFKQEIQSLAKFNYIIQGGKIIIAVFSIALFFWFYQTRLVSVTDYFIPFHDWFYNTIYLSAAGGVGAFISIVQKISTFKIDKYLPDLRTKLDASIRVLLGCVFGNLLVWFVKADFFNLIDMESLNFKDVNSTLLILTTAVIGGFGERLVPSILGSKSEV